MSQPNLILFSPRLKDFPRRSISRELVATVGVKEKGFFGNSLYFTMKLEKS